MLTLQKLKDMESNTIFYSGLCLIEHPWPQEATNLTEGTKVPVKWVAVRGGIWDWCIYHSLDNNFGDILHNKQHILRDKYDIKQYGAKLTDWEKIRELIECDNEAFNMYRF